MRLYLCICTGSYLHFLQTIALFVNVQLHKIGIILWAKETSVSILKMYFLKNWSHFNKFMSLLFCNFTMVSGRENDCNHYSSII